MTDDHGGFVLRSGPLVPQIEQIFRSKIRQSVWLPKQRIPSEAALAVELGVGRSSIREAIRLLTQAGLLEVRHGVGTFVVAAEDLEHADEFTRLLRRSQMLEVFEVRRALEVEAARLAAERAQPEDLERLRRRLTLRHSHFERDVEKFVDTDLDFHTEVVRLSGNAVLLSLFESVRPLLRKTLIDMVDIEEGVPDTSQAHDRLLDALWDSDPDAAVAATRENIDTVLRQLRILDS
ncbi:FadR family transcriptional regulator [Rhodococcus sp. ACPA4]|jgi:DNA-binding FadR family transcriptional regulator|uniref:FCD domain-containing protein n=1 Tax=Rhodococcus globerulus TaxID=33008 RepID=A0ABU4BX72_RHOGO|nr:MULTISPECIES: FCD domain-containing protein [Rhodococcus]KJF24451.1 Pyruvate dehydrogenase complex repressor [Rhodococcus sp. AD45]MCE4267863.1 FadR family transcriptional regulator [Rhodococcus globerulus]MDV6268842.1 FCD domain-containing protein [Rhodococcus globerulus]PBC43347.1 FadR family transcriptional regulator [Rhodococcus sp. ACPA4]PSR42749.1 FadR family transcriptional regulator [Rhodococcus sp. AD45-ID]